jgi:hypothetical protein
MRRTIPAIATAVLSACSVFGLSSNEPAQRSVLLQYDAALTPADSLAASVIGGAPVTMYPIARAVAIDTRAPDKAFVALTPTPRITDFDSAGPRCSALSLYIATTNRPTTADSSIVASIGIRIPGFAQDQPRDQILGDFNRSTLRHVLSGINLLADDANLAVVDLELEGCPFIEADHAGEARAPR